MEVLAFLEKTADYRRPPPRRFVRIPFDFSVEWRPNVRDGRHFRPRSFGKDE